MYGQARLYVKTQQGNPIGWVDVRTGERVIEVPELQPAFEAAIAAVQPDIPPAYTPRRVILESVETTHRPKGDGPSPRRSTPDPDQSVWTPVERTATGSAKRRSARSARTPVSRPTLSTNSAPGAAASTEVAIVQTEKFRFGRLDVASDRCHLWRGTTGLQLVTRQLNTLSGREADWDYLTTTDLGIEDAAVDFVVGGPGGIFAIDVITPTTAVFRGTGFARRTSEVLTRAMESGIWVRHLLVPVGFSLAEAALLPEELPLIARRQLLSYLVSQPQSLSPSEVELALGYARLRWTWRS